MENSFVPPEVLRQAAGQSDQPTDDDSEISSSAHDPQQALNDPASNQMPSSIPGLSGSDPVGQQTGDSPAGPAESLSLKQSLLMLSPWGLLRAMAEGIFGGKTEAQQQAEQQRLSWQQHVQQSEQQDWQAQQQRQIMQQQQLQQQVETLKSQGRRIGPNQGSVLFSQTTSGDLSELRLTEQAVQDAQRQAARQQQRGLSDPGSASKKGPVSVSDVSNQKSGSQKLSEMSMGE